MSASLSTSSVCEVYPPTECVKSSPTTFSAAAPEFVMPTFSVQAPEFVPNFLKAEQVTEFVPYHMSEAAQYYSPYDTAQSQVNQYGSYNVVPSIPAPVSCMICLDDYSDCSSSDDDEPAEQAQVKPSLPEVTSKLRYASEDETSLPTNSPASTYEPEAYTSTESESSDKEQESDQEGLLQKLATPVPEQHEAPDDESAGRFKVMTLLKLRHSVDQMDGYEERLDAMEVSPEELPEKPAGEAPPMPARRKTTSGHGKGQGKGGHGARKSQQDVRRPKTLSVGGFDLSRGDETKKVELAVSDNSWTALQRARRSVEAEAVVSDEDVVRSMKSILNKLTVEKFVPLYEKLVSCGIRTTVHLETLIHEIFEKATHQHHFINMYADLCVLLQTHFAENPVTDNAKMSFKKVLLNGCQAFFERHLAPPTDLDSYNEEQRDALTLKYKTRMLGNIKFVGSLLVRQMLASKVMFAIMEELLTGPTGETMESLACLLTVVGPKFDTADFPMRPMLSDVFSQVQVLSKSQTVNCRVRCLLKDVLELRASQWQDRKPKKIEGPSTLKEVADSQAAENGQSVASKGSQSASRRSPPSQYGGSKTSPSKYGGSDKTGGNRISSLSSLFKRGTDSPKSSAAQAPAWKAGLKTECKPTPGSRKQPSMAPFDQEACRKEVSAALAELRASHEVKEAILRISAIAVPSAQQPDELCDMLAQMSEEGSEASRKVCFELIAGLFAEGHWKANVLNKGLQDFTEDVCTDLKCDVPALPRILREELHPVLAPLVETGILQAVRHDALVAAF